MILLFLTSGTTSLLPCVSVIFSNIARSFQIQFHSNSLLQACDLTNTLISRMNFNYKLIAIDWFLRLL